MKLSITNREVAGKQVGKERSQGKIPAVMYGPKFSSTNFWLNEKEFGKVFDEAGFSNLIDVVDQDGTKRSALIKDVQQHPVNDKYMHVDLYAVDQSTEITAEVPILFEGVSPAEANNVGFVVHAVESVAVRCLPKDLPSELVVDVSGLENEGDSFLVSSIALPEGVEFDSKQDVNAAAAYIAVAQKIEEVLAEIEADHAAEGQADEDEEGTEEGEEGEEGAESGEENEGAAEGEKSEE